jgi:hypothetical protein
MKITARNGGPFVTVPNQEAEEASLLLGIPRFDDDYELP